MMLQRNWQGGNHSVGVLTPDVADELSLPGDFLLGGGFEAPPWLPEVVVPLLAGLLLHACRGQDRPSLVPHVAVLLLVEILLVLVALLLVLLFGGHLVEALLLHVLVDLALLLLLLARGVLLAGALLGLVEVFLISGWRLVEVLLRVLPVLIVPPVVSGGGGLGLLLGLVPIVLLLDIGLVGLGGLARHIAVLLIFLLLGAQGHEGDEEVVAEAGEEEQEGEGEEEGYLGLVVVLGGASIYFPQVTQVVAHGGDGCEHGNVTEQIESELDVLGNGAQEMLPRINPEDPNQHYYENGSAGCQADDCADEGGSDHLGLARLLGRKVGIGTGSDGDTVAAIESDVVVGAEEDGEGECEEEGGDAGDECQVYERPGQAFASVHVGCYQKWDLKMDFIAWVSMVDQLVSQQIKY